MHVACPSLLTPHLTPIVTLSQYLYKEGWEKQKATGYILPPDAVPFVHAHHSSDVQSEVMYPTMSELLETGPCPQGCQ